MTDDPFAYDPNAERESTPTLKFPTIGTVHKGTVVSIDDAVQGIEYGTNPPQPSVRKDGSPATHVVLVLDIDGEKASVWAEYWSGSPRWAPAGGMFAAIAEALKVAGKPLEVGGTLSVKHTGMDGARKLYAAKYEPPAAAPAADPFAGADDEPPF